MRARGLVLLAAGGLVLLAGCVRPAPLTESARLARSRADLERMFPEPLNGPVDLYAAMARAVVHNREHRVALLEHSLERQRLTGSRLAMLPQLLARNEYYGRNNVPGSFSESLATGLQSLEPSTSQDRYGWRNDFTVAFNLLDFGLSYVRAKQQANEVLIAEERETKVVGDLVADVRASYYRAAGASQLMPEVQRIAAEVQEALKLSRELDEQGLVDPVASLSYRRSLLDKQRELVGIQRELEAAQIELARLLNVRPGIALELPVPAFDELQLPDTDLPVALLENDALSGRPELREEDYRLRIQRLEVRRAMLSVLPGLEVRVGRNADTNDFLENDDWWSYSAVLTKNLVEIVTAPNAIGQARSEVELADARRLALSMGVLAQVHVAASELRAAEAELHLAHEVRGVEERLHGVTRDRVEAERESELELVRKQTDHVLAQLRAWSAYADLQGALGRLHVATGQNPLRDLGDPDEGEIAVALRAADARWERRIRIARDYPDAFLPNGPELPPVATDAPR